jgi:Aspartyl protease
VLADTWLRLIPPAHAWPIFAQKGSTIAYRFLPSVVPFQEQARKCEVQGSSTTGSQVTRQVIPFRLIDGRILVPVRINGQGPFTFIFDSGASAALSPELAKRLGLRLSKPQSGSGTGAAAVETSTTTLSQVALGSLVLRDQTADVIPMRDMPPAFGTQQIDGIIGRPVFSTSVVEVDYGESQVILTDPQNLVPSATDQVVSFTRIRDVPLVDAALDGHSGTFGVDLGARSSLLVTSSFAERYNLGKSLPSSAEMITGWGLGGPIHSRLARAHSLTFANFTIENPIVRLSTQKAGLLSKSDISGLIGADILRQFCITFDDSRHRIFFRKSKFFGQPTSFDKSGMWLVLDGPAFSVLEVVPDAAASRAGIEQGDRLIAITIHLKAIR